MRKRSLLSLLAAVCLPGLIACQAMVPGGSSAKGGLSGPSSVTSKTEGTDLNSGADFESPPPPDAASPVSRSAIDPLVKGDRSAVSGGGGGGEKMYAWGPEAPMPPRSDPDNLDWCTIDGKTVPCPGEVWDKPGDPAPTFDTSKQPEPESFRILLGSHPFNTQEAVPWPKYVDVFEDQNGIQLYQSYIVQVGATLRKPDGTSAFSWWDIIRGPYLRMVFTPKGQPPANATYVDMEIEYRHLSGGNSNASACGFSCDVQPGDTVTFYVYYETDSSAAVATDYFKKPPKANLGGIRAPAIPFPAGAYDAFVADTKHVHALGSFVIRDGNAPMMRAPRPDDHWRDQLTIPRSIP